MFINDEGMIHQKHTVCLDSVLVQEAGYIFGPLLK